MDGGSDAPTRLDLRSGRTVWDLTPVASTPSAPLAGSIRTDIAIVGAGITGAFLAERFSRAGREVVLLDRHAPHSASTAASTALLQWEIDAPLVELEGRLGFDAAAAIYRRSLAAVESIGALVAGEGGPQFHPRDTLYLAGTALDPAALREEADLRRRAGLPSLYLDRDALRAGFGFEREAAILSGGSAEAHPVALARALLEKARARGARVHGPETVCAYDFGFQGATLGTESGFEVGADIVLLANGYEMPPFLRCARHSLVSTWALATAPQPPDLFWSGRALVWEASDPYAYLRTTPEGRLVIGGEDEPLSDAGARDALIPRKTQALLDALARLVPGAAATLEAAWAGFFGRTDDGLPLIGRVPGFPRCYAAFGYGGNGITFSALAAEMIAAEIAGRPDPLADIVRIDR